jgi:predicted permease
VGLAWARSGAHFDEVSISRLVLNVGIPCLVFRSLTSLDVPPTELARMAGLAAAVMSMFAVGGFAVLKAMFAFLLSVSRGSRWEWRTSQCLRHATWCWAGLSFQGASHCGPSLRHL